MGIESPPRITSAVVPSGDPRRNTELFDYDDLYRLKGVQYSFGLPGEDVQSDGSIACTYDRIGNMLSQISNMMQQERGTSVSNLGAMLYGSTTGSSSRHGRAPGDPPGPHALSAIDGGATPYEYDDNGNATAFDGMTLA